MNNPSLKARFAPHLGFSKLGQALRKSRLLLPLATGDLDRYVDEGLLLLPLCPALLAPQGAAESAAERGFDDIRLGRWRALDVLLQGVKEGLKVLVGVVLPVAPKEPHARYCPARRQHCVRHDGEAAQEARLRGGVGRGGRRKQGGHVHAGGGRVGGEEEPVKGAGQAAHSGLGLQGAMSEEHEATAGLAGCSLVFARGVVASLTFRRLHVWVSWPADSRK